MSEVDSCLALIQEGEYSPFLFLQIVNQEVRKNIFFEVFNLQITKKYSIRKSQLRKLSHLRTVRKSNKLFKGTQA
jgi:hypothetical protein